MITSGEDFRIWLKKIPYWFRTPKAKRSYRNDFEEEKFGESDDIWNNFHLFNGEWHEIQNQVNWYESPNVPDIYEDHVGIFKQEMDMARPDERYYEENLDDGDFMSRLYCEERLPSDRGDLRIVSEINTKSPPSGDNNFAFVEYFIKTQLRYDIPQGIQFLPRILSYPLNKFFKWPFYRFIAEEMVEYDGEYARERTTEYLQYLRKYHGEEPTQQKSRQSEFKPVPEEGIFFQ